MKVAECKLNGEKVKVDPESLLAFEKGLVLDIKRPDFPGTETIPNQGSRASVWQIDLAKQSLTNSFRIFFENTLTSGSYLEFSAIPAKLCKNLEDKRDCSSFDLA